MITKNEYANLLHFKEEIETAAKAVIDKVKELNLTLTTDINVLTIEYKTRLFEKVLTVDKGLKMLYSLLRTDDSRLKMLNDTITLDGYDEIDELEIIVKDYLFKFEHLSNGREYRSVGINAENFITAYGGLTEKAFEGKVIDVTESDEYKALKGVADSLNELFTSGVLNQNAFHNGFYNDLRKFLPASEYSKSVNVNEEIIYYHIMSKMNKD